MEINQNHFLITELHYKTASLNKETEPLNETIEQNSKFKLGVNENLSDAFIEVLSDINTHLELEDSESISYRQLQITVQYFFKVRNANSSVEIRSALEKKEVIYSIHSQLRDLIKNITGQDFQSPIIVDSVAI